MRLRARHRFAAALCCDELPVMSCSVRWPPGHSRDVYAEHALMELAAPASIVATKATPKLPPNS